jgi:hypothetical protein
VNTQQLVRDLAADLEDRPNPSSHLVWRRLALMTALASMASLEVILLVLARSPHLAHGPTVTLIFTALAGLVLAAGAFWTVLQLSFPEARVGFLWLLLPLAILISGIGLEWSHVPRPSWSSRLWGDNPLACYLCVTALSLPILLAILVALRDGASTRPRLSGAMAGLVASGITTALYTIHCPENSLLFVMSWHGLAVLTVTFIGALAAERYLRW